MHIQTIDNDIYDMHTYTYIDRYTSRERYIPVCEEPGLLEFEDEAVLRGVTLDFIYRDVSRYIDTDK